MLPTSKRDRLFGLIGKGLEQGAAAARDQLRPEDPLNALLRKQQMDNLQEERDQRQVQHLEQRSGQAGTAQVVPSLQQAEEAIPGLYTKGMQETPKLKSMGGGKQLIPNFLVSPLERFGVLDKGAAKERQALQDLQNMKVYDASGKAINEAEMKRLADSMGTFGFNSSEDIVGALRQMGYTTLEKQKGVSAGATPKALKTFREQGGLAGANTLDELLGATARSKMMPAGAPSGGGDGLKSAAQQELMRRRKGR